ncbi:MAG: hypothetical protein KIT11_08605 [Fimbriimonadaceae bacterium]|nr:hypothetical protein [Fimbriimonadaceae bacterium]QYK56413.1 MAG: hypothetical protein KF733_02800 [Fimbriimonadaceae bacterium]
MSEHNESRDKDLLEELGYEIQDVPARPVALGLVPFFGTVVVTIIVAYFFFVWVAPEMTRRPASTQLERTRKPAEGIPLIQTNVTAHKDMVDVIQEERKKESTYGWTDRKTGHVHIPIDRAMAQVLAEGLPSRANARVPEGEIPPTVLAEEQR